MIKIETSCSLISNTNNETNVLFAKRPSGVGDEIPGALLGVEAAIADIVRRIVPAEEELAGVIGERDALRRDLEVHDRRVGHGLLLEQHSYGLLYGLRSGQRFRVQCEEVEHVTS